MNLLLSLDLTYAKMSNFALFKGKCPIFSYFTHNQGKIFLILPITQGGHMYT